MKNEITVFTDVELFCSRCSEALDASLREENCIFVGPCERCLDVARDAGEDEGKASFFRTQWTSTMTDQQRMDDDNVETLRGVVSLPGKRRVLQSGLMPLSGAEQMNDDEVRKARPDGSKGPTPERVEEK